MWSNCEGCGDRVKGNEEKLMTFEMFEGLLTIITEIERFTGGGAEFTF